MHVRAAPHDGHETLSEGSADFATPRICGSEQRQNVNDTT